MARTHGNRRSAFSSRFRWAAYLLGFGFSGFFDGILLHQILQWHHLLSAIQDGPLADLRSQVVADGAFHALMYVVAAAGLVQLVRSREELARTGAAGAVSTGFLIGFGVWHVVDAVVVHWLVGLHRIRMDTDNRLFWDLLWLAVFGIVPLATALWRRARAIPPGGGAGVAGATLLVVATALAGGIAARSADPDGATLTVVLRPGAGPAPMLAALTSSDTRVLWSDPAGAVWVLKPGEGLDRFDLYRHGALFVAGTVAPAGCSAWLGAG
jgi:uncharacterized membrane protein